MDIAICGPGHSGALPAGVERIDAPTPTVFVIGRLAVDGPDDVPAVHALQDEMFLGPLSGWAERRVAEPRVAESSGHTGPLAFFEDLGDRQGGWWWVHHTCAHSDERSGEQRPRS